MDFIIVFGLDLLSDSRVLSSGSVAKLLHSGSVAKILDSGSVAKIPHFGSASLVELQNSVLKSQHSDLFLLPKELELKYLGCAVGLVKKLGPVCCLKKKLYD